MSETLEERIIRTGKDVDKMITAYASDIVEILEDKDKKLKKEQRKNELLLIAIDKARNLLNDEYDYSDHCKCEFSGSGGTVRMCDFHSSLNEYQKEALNNR